VTIIPDDKDWTWVIERPCRDCGFDAAQFDVATVPRLIGELNGAWREVLRRPDVAVRPSPDKWSPLEYACHVRDVFRLFDTRLRSMIVEDGARFENWDQDVTAVEARYDLQEPGSVARELSQAGEVLAVGFERVSGQQWLRRGHRSDGNSFTVASLAVYMIHDPIHHLWDVGAAAP